MVGLSGALRRETLSGRLFQRPCERRARRLLRRAVCARSRRAWASHLGDGGFSKGGKASRKGFGKASSRSALAFSLAYARRGSEREHTRNFEPCWTKCRDMHDSSTPPPLCPLARDQYGQPIALPEGAAAWLVRRHTGGRPRVFLDAQKQPMRLPLTYTDADLEEILAPATYQLVLINQRGEPLEPKVQTTITIGQIEDEGDGEDSEDAIERAPMMMAALPPSTTDTRLVLEANIRATQMAYQHNQRTLELGLQMADTLRQGVQVLVEAQAEVMRSMSSARGFFRNAAPPVMLPAPPQPPEPARRRSEREDESDEEDEEEEYDEPSPQQSDWIENLKPVIATVTAEIMKALLGSKGGGGAGGGGLKLPEILDWRRASLGAGAEAVAKSDDATAPPAPSLQEQISDPATVQHAFTVLGKLTPDEQKAARMLAAELSDAERALWFQQLRRLSVDEAAEKVREILGKLVKKPAA